jgi:hypothetical protein
MQKLCISLIVLFLFLSCTDDKPILTFENQTFVQFSQGDCTMNPCARVQISIPIANGNFVVADSINQHLLNVVNSIVYFGESPSEGKSYEEVSNSFITSFEDLKADFPEHFASWYADIDAEVSYESEEIINITLNHATFTGGAHGYAAVRSLVFDRNTGSVIPVQDLFQDEKAFLEIAEVAFRAQNEISEDIDLQSQFFGMESGFILPENVFFEKDGLKFLYNPYEIASYAQGSQSFILTYETLKPFLKRK